MERKYLKEGYALNNNIRYRLKFSKLFRMRFIGHLDLLSLFQRCIKRTELPIAYSQGFHPHQIMSFALPLSLGMGSVGEYVDIELEKEVDPSEILSRFNEISPDDFKILDIRKLMQGEKNAASIVEAGIYEVTLPQDSLITGIEVEEMLSQNEIKVIKKSKKKEVEADIRKHIYEAFFTISEDNKKIIEFLISSGSKENLKPEVVINYLYEKVGQVNNPYKVYYLRKDLLKKQSDSFKSIMEMSD